MNERRKLLIFVGVFVACWFIPVRSPRFMGAVHESLELVRWYAREHVILCLVPAFFIAGAIGVFVSQGAVMKYLGARAKKIVAYPVAAVSGTVLAVCSCTVLPLFAGIYSRGAGLGPATAFLYSGPAINAMAIILTARILGWKLGLARAVGAVVFSVVLGLLMQLIFQKEEDQRAQDAPIAPTEDSGQRRLIHNAVFFFSMVGFLVFANWGAPKGTTGLWALIHSLKWILAGLMGALVITSLLLWFKKDEMKEWVDASWDFAKQILPLLLAGVLVAGLLLGGPDGGDKGLIPAQWTRSAVGGNSLWANLFASMAGAFMYFATLTEVPILKGLLDSGMGDGPALSLLLAGPALSLPNMLVIRSVMGTRKTIVYVGLVVLLSTIAGSVYGLLV